ncbi:hypothetical protein [Azospirillum endophyticum]
MKERLSALKAERTTLAAEIDALGSDAPEILLPVNLPELYRWKIAELESVLGDGDEGRAAMEMIRSMVDRIVLSPLLPGRRAGGTASWRPAGNPGGVRQRGPETPTARLV